MLTAAGVVAVSTKRDVLDATAEFRGSRGPLWCYDPSGSLPSTPGVELVGWSPLRASTSWEGAVAVAESMVGAARPGAERGEAAHWSERAAALLAPLFHGAALQSSEMSGVEQVVAWVNRREPEAALAALARHDSELALDLLCGVVATDSREQSGIWSTASGVLAAYRTAGALESARRPAIDFEALLAGTGTLYVVASAEHQRHGAPLVAGLVRELRQHAYSAALRGQRAERPVLLVLDELANIAPLHDLPELVSEGGSQGLVTLACLQDLSQARSRWGVAADGFLSLFGAKLVLGGLADTRTIEAISLLAGDHDVMVRSRTRSALGRPASRTLSPRRQRRLPPDAVSGLPAGQALLLRTGSTRLVTLPRVTSELSVSRGAGEALARRISRRGADPPTLGR
ncbi:MAG: hypothetical protein JWM85_928 [Acidimicrobiaceae bacterium]|nr:hypothetical protein [Acidimicrobiaceae bacterium]